MSNTHLPYRLNTHRLIICTLFSGALILLFSLFWVTTESAVADSPNAIMITAGQNENPTVTVSTMTEGTAQAITLNVLYDSTLLVPTDCTEIQNELLCNPNYIDDDDLPAVRATFASLTPIADSADLIDITFLCNGSGTSELIIEIEHFSTGTGEQLAVTSQNNTFTCDQVPTAVSLSGISGTDGIMTQSLLLLFLLGSAATIAIRHAVRRS